MNVFKKRLAIFFILLLCWGIGFSLPVKASEIDQTNVLCFRSYFPGPGQGGIYSCVIWGVCIWVDDIQPDGPSSSCPIPI
jgi:hypothetical protein